MALSWPFKDPDEVLDYTIDWTKRIATGDSITGSTWVISGSVVKNSDTFTSANTTIWLHGGLEGETCSLTNEVTTSAGRTMDQTVKLKIKSK